MVWSRSGPVDTMSIGAPIDMVSTGPDREHTILLRHPYQPDAESRSARRQMALSL